jgi:transposase InsO family protein
MRYAPFEREALGIYWGVVHFDEYLDGRHFTVFTDHKPLVAMMSQGITNKRVLNWAIRLATYIFTIKYRPGLTNANADMLSRYPVVPLRGRRSKEIQTNESLSNNFDGNSNLAVTVRKFKMKHGTVSTEDEEVQAAALQPEVSAGKTDDGTPFERYREVGFDCHSRDRQPSPNFMGSIRIVRESTSTRPDVRFVKDISPAERQAIWKKMDNLKDTQQESPLFNAMRTFLIDQTLPEDQRLAKSVVNQAHNFTIGVKDVLLREVDGELKICLPPSLVRYVLHDAHQTGASAHRGQGKTLHRIKERWWWPSMGADVSLYLAACGLCKAHKFPPRRNRQYLGERPPPTDAWQRLHVDVWTPNGESARGHACVIAFVDAFSKYLVLKPSIDHQAHTVVGVFIDDVAANYGLPTELYSDNGKEFTSNLHAAVMDAFGVTHHLVTVYRPQANGQIERMFSVIRPMIATLCDSMPRNWDRCLPIIAHAYNTAFQETIQNTPFYLMFGRDPTPLVHGNPNPAFGPAPELQVRLNMLKKARSIVTDHLQQDFERNKKYYDAQSIPKEIGIGDVVLRQAVVPPDALVRKIYPKFAGPYRVTVKQGQVVGIVPLDYPADEPYFIHIDRVRKCSRNIVLDQRPEILRAKYFAADDHEIEY